VVFTDPEEIHAHLLGKGTFFDEVSDGLSMREGVAFGIVGDIAEGVEAEDERELHRFTFGTLHSL
jgi:hypothetical protein